jgi:glycosyltransferase involved in cell wall biosynthesis
MNKLSGYIPGRDVIKLDYPFFEAAASLLPVCDELILCDSDSTDGTREAMEKFAAEVPEPFKGRVRVINRPWEDPVGDRMMLIKWLNWIRPHCKYSMQLTTDADEVLCPKAYPAIREAVAEGGCRYFRRLNFWRDHRHLAPEGRVVGEYVARLGPTAYEMCSDEQRPDGEPEIRKKAQFDDRLRFFHYGFIRRKQAFIDKTRVVQRAILNDLDQRIVSTEGTDRNWVDNIDLGRPLIDYPYRDHPPCAHAWLKQNGWEVP